jgi:putative heme-binding domain-containing protein
MTRFAIRFILPILAITALIYACTSTPEIINKYDAKMISINAEGAVKDAAKIRQEANVELADDFELDLWAADSLIQDPIAISVAPDGRIFYTQATRQTSSEFDIRGHHDWMTASLSFETVEDRREFLRKTFTADSEQSEAHLKDLNEDGVLDWRDLTVEKENVWFVTDQNMDGVADQSQRYLADFGEEITDVANGIEYHDGDVYIAVGPDLWRTKDQNKDGIADETESLSHGFAIHVGFSGHGMSGVTVGPQGRIWWGIGDIGMNVVDKEGKHWKYPNRGVVVRSERDGSNFEVFAMGVRNTHEFTFDKFGNLISVDNDGDHAGESERLVYLLDGSDTGWRINWQFGKYTDPTNNDYKVWMDEGMFKPRHDEQAAYFLPTIQNFVNGPTGMVYNPGTALSPKYYDHFFISEFRGSPNNSPIHAFTLKPDGAGFALNKSEEVVKGLLPTGLDFGPDGALYFGDWINGWNTKDEGRIWKLDLGAAAGADMELRSKVQELLTADFSKIPTGEIMDMLGHQDQRLRRKAQFLLADMGDKAGLKILRDVANSPNANQLARIHALWGISQLIRQGVAESSELEPFLLDADEEIIAQAAKLTGDVRHAGADETLIGLLGHPSIRVRFFAMEALGRTEVKSAVTPIVEMLREDDGKDTWLRHGGMLALGRIGDADARAELAADPSQTIRLVAVVALRRMESPAIKSFLYDEDEYVVAEAARAITDDYQIAGAMSPLAQILNTRPWTNEPLIRRIINANLTVGNNRTIDNLITYLNNSANPEDMRAEALATLAHWAHPSLFDRVDGRYRGQRNKSDGYVKEKLGAVIQSLIANGNGMMRTTAIQAVASLKLEAATDQLAGLLKSDQDPAIRAAALTSLDKLGAPGIETYLRTALNDRDNSVRSRALSLLPESTVDPAEATKLYADIIETGSTSEAQAALTGLSALKSPDADVLLTSLLGQLTTGKLPAPIRLDLIEAVEARENESLTSALEAYEKELTETDDLGLFSTALAGGQKRPGRGVFYWNSAGQCTRCHAIFEYGGNVGPNLSGIGHRLSPREILTSLIRPSAALALGHETVIVTLNDESVFSGIVLERTPEHLKLKVGKTEIRTIAQADIAEEETVPSSMPSAEDNLSRREIRDLVAFLVSQKGEESK